MSNFRGVIANRIGRKLAPALALVILPLVPAAEAAPRLRLDWEGLTIVLGKTVSIAMPGGVIISGKATALEAEALVVDVNKTTDRRAYPKGPVRAPRAALSVIQMQRKGHLGRILLIPLGTILGAVGGAAAYEGLGDCHLIGWGCRQRHPIANVAFAAILAGGVVGGYKAGNADDTYWTTIEIGAEAREAEPPQGSPGP